MDEFDPSEMDDAELARTLETMQEDMETLKRTLQDMGALQDAIEQAESEGFDVGENTVADLVEFLQSEMGVGEEMLAELQEAADAFLQSVDAESLDEASAAAMRDWLAEQDEAGEGEEEGDGEGDEAEEEGNVTMEDLQEAKAAIGQVAEHLGDMKEMLTAMRDEQDELQRRLSEVEDEPVNRSLTGDAPGDFIDEEDGTEGDTGGGNQSAPGAEEIGF